MAVLGWAGLGRAATWGRKAIFSLCQCREGGQWGKERGGSSSLAVLSESPHWLGASCDPLSQDRWQEVSQGRGESGLTPSQWCLADGGRGARLPPLLFLHLQEGDSEA